MLNESDRVLIFKVPNNFRKRIRLDNFLSTRSIGLSRSRIQVLIKSGDITVNSLQSKASYLLKPGDLTLVRVPPAKKIDHLYPEAIPLDIIFEDTALIILNKPPGLVVHPAPGHYTGTMVHGLLHHCKDLSGIGGIYRPGIVHRLDKDTSGLIVVAKNDQAHNSLSLQFKNGQVKKQYITLVWGQVKKDKGTIDLPIGRHPKKRKEMAVTNPGGRSAVTHWRKNEIYNSGFSLLEVTLETGRTHQIRVHLSHIGHPVVGDPVYGKRQKSWNRHPLSIKYLLPQINRQMLHAYVLGFIHPDKNRYCEFKASLPPDMAHLIQILKNQDR